MIPETMIEPPRPVAEAESLVGVASTGLFCLFAGGFYYPEGGAGDFRAFGTVDELKALYAANNEKWAYDNGSSPWGHICDHATMRIVLEADNRRDGIHWQNDKGLATQPAPQMPEKHK